MAATDDSIGDDVSSEREHLFATKTPKKSCRRWAHFPSLPALLSYTAVQLLAANSTATTVTSAVVHRFPTGASAALTHKLTNQIEIQTTFC